MSKLVKRIDKNAQTAKSKSNNKAEPNGVKGLVVWLENESNGPHGCEDSDETYRWRGTTYYFVKEVNAELRDLPTNSYFSEYPGESRNYKIDDMDFSPVAGRDIWVVVERYGDGDTFRSSKGLSRIQRVFPTKDQAETWLETDAADSAKSKAYFGGHEAWEIYRVEVVEVD